MIQKIIAFYEKYIIQLWERLEKYFSWILINLQMQFVKQKTLKIAKRWEIFLINFGVNIGSEYEKIRPWIIISGDEINKWKTVIAIPISSQIQKIFMYDVILDWNQTNSLTNKSVVKTSHIRNLDKKRLVKKIWQLDEENLEKIQKQIISMITKKSIPPKE